MMMDLPTNDSNDSENHGGNVCCHRNSNGVRIECGKKLVQHKYGQKAHANPFPTSTSKSARNRTTATALLLYFSYTLSIHLLWTNCVIFTEPAQLKLNVNPSWNLLHHQRTESNRSLNSNNSHNNLKSNLDDVSSLSHSNRLKLNGIAIDNNGNSSNKNSNKNDIGRAANANQFDFLTNIPAFSANRELTSTASLQAIDVNQITRTNEAVSPMPVPIQIGMRMRMRMGMRGKHFHTIKCLKRLKRTTSLETRRLHIAYKLFSKRNEFRRHINDVDDDDDEIRFKRYQFESENVIKSAKKHAIKRNVNTFTPEALGDNSNLSIINTIFPKPKSIKPSSLQLNELITTTAIKTVTVTTTTTSVPTSISDAKSIFNRSEGSGSDQNTSALVNSAVLTAFRQHQTNQTVNGDRKLKANNSTTSNRMENNRNNNTRITSSGIVTASETAMTMTTTTMMNPITRNFSSVSAPIHSGRFRVNDVFEMDTKQKYFNSGSGGGDSSNGNSSYRRNKDNQVTSFENDEQNKWHVEHRNGKRIISLLGLFELSTRNGLRVEGLSELAAAELAVKHINKRDGLLPGYTLQLITNDTKCDPGVGVDRFFHAVYTKRMTRVQMLLGSACSEVTESLAKVVPHWNIVQVSFGSTSPALSDRTEFPLFYRTVAPDSSHNPARIAFIRRFGWDTVTTFSQNEEIHSLAVNDLVTELENANISCAATITFAETDFRNQLKMLRDLDTRIIIGSFSHDLAPKIFCEAYKLGMFGADYVWILHEIVGEPWWHRMTHECSQKQLQEVSENLLIVSSHNSIVSNEISYSGLTYSMFVDELNLQLNVSQPAPLSRYAAQTYDAVWAIALSLNGAEAKWKQLKSNSTARLHLDHFDYTRYDMALEFFHQFSRLNFLGVSGPVSFSGADRIGISVFSQVQDGRLQSVALFHPSKLHLDFDCQKCLPIKWKNGQVPIAKRVFKLRVATVSPIAFFIVSTLALIGIILSISFLAFNLHFRKLKAIKLSSPKLSNITAFGCILVYAAVILLGLDHSTLPASEKAFPVVCTARVYLLSSGFSLAFGSMFAKTYRVHRIFTRSGLHSVCKDRMLQDKKLISLVCALLLLDGLVLGFWVVFDPMERHLSNLTLEISLTDRSVVYQPQVEVCRSQNTQIWLGALYIYKGLLLVVGVYMAWETRHVKIPALNDSQYIGVSVYSVVITSAIVVVLANLISERVTLAFLTITALILTSTTATLCLLFLPKMHDIWGKGEINDPVIHSMGLKMECNTRRFMIDDKRELQYRVEVQNRVYKKELAALDIEIGKLEKLLETPSSTSSSDLSIPRLIKHELAVVNEENEKSSTTKQQRTPSIGSGLPLLLLSVLPPVIQRVSWPSADIGNNTMRKSVTFSSQPQLEDESSVARLPAIDLLHLRLTHQQATADARRGLIDRIIGFFGSKPPSRKASTSSIAGGSSGIAAALKVHMGLFSNIVPTAASCNAIDRAGVHPLRRMSIARSGTSCNAINTRCSSITYDPLFRERSINLPPPPPFIISTESDSTNTSRKNIYVDTEHETKVNFHLPLGRRASILNQPTLRERVKGSPRFPHRIAPTSSLNALVESTEASGASNTSSKSKWKSMEDSTMFASSSTSFNTSNC